MGAMGIVLVHDSLGSFSQIPSSSTTSLSSLSPLRDALHQLTLAPQVGMEIMNAAAVKLFFPGISFIRLRSLQPVLLCHPLSRQVNCCQTRQFGRWMHYTQPSKTLRVRFNDDKIPRNE